MTRLDLLRPVRGPLLAAVLLQALAGLLVLAPLLAILAFAAAWLDDEPLPGRAVVLAAVTGTLGAAGATAAATWLSHRADADLVRWLRGRLAHTIRRLPVPAVAGLGAGRVKKVVQDDTGALHYLVAHTLLDATALLVTPLAGLTVLAVIDWRLALIALLPLALGVGWYLRAMRGSGARFGEYAAAQQRVNGAIMDYVRGLPVAKVYGGPGGARSRYAAAVSAFHDFFRGWSAGTAASTTASWLVVTPAVTTTVLVVVGVLGAARGHVEATGVLAAALLGPAISAPVAVAGPRLQALRSGLSALDSIAAFLDQPLLAWGRSAPPGAGSGLRLEGVSHRYQEEAEPALAEVSLDLPERGLVAVVGASGSGKSTLAALLARFTDPTAGRILLGSVDLCDLREEDLYERIAFVFQDSSPRRGSVRENLTGGRRLAQERIERAARRAAIHEDLLALPRGYDTILGDEVELSGGQRQRLALARALLREPDLLVLDEPLAAVDPSARLALLDTLRAEAEQRSVLLIAHQLELAARAERILVLDRGRLAGDGDHHSLLASCPAYRALHGAGAPGAHDTGRTAS